MTSSQIHIFAPLLNKLRCTLCIVSNLVPDKVALYLCLVYNSFAVNNQHDMCLRLHESSVLRNKSFRNFHYVIIFLTRIITNISFEV